jgi:hypothetical protein
MSKSQETVGCPFNGIATSFTAGIEKGVKSVRIHEREQEEKQEKSTSVRKSAMKKTRKRARGSGRAQKRAPAGPVVRQMAE